MAWYFVDKNDHTKGEKPCCDCCRGDVDLQTATILCEKCEPRQMKYIQELKAKCVELTDKELQIVVEMFTEVYGEFSTMEIEEMVLYKKLENILKGRKK